MTKSDLTTTSIHANGERLDLALQPDGSYRVLDHGNGETLGFATDGTAFARKLIGGIPRHEVKANAILRLLQNAVDAGLMDMCDMTRDGLKSLLMDVEQALWDMAKSSHFAAHFLDHGLPSGEPSDLQEVA